LVRLHLGTLVIRAMRVSLCAAPLTTRDQCTGIALDLAVSFSPSLSSLSFCCHALLSSGA
jgi:hypothetical protein